MKIAQAQGPEQTQMQAMATAWGVPAPSGEMAMGGSMGGDASALMPLSGAAFDKAFLTRMTAHHQGALPMAQAELSAGSNPQAKQLAQSIVTSQTAEIAQMTSMLAALQQH